MTNLPIPPKTHRYCIICKKQTTFVYDPTTTHSRCKICGNWQSRGKRFSAYSIEKLKRKIHIINMRYRRRRKAEEKEKEKEIIEYRKKHKEDILMPSPDFYKMMNKKMKCKICGKEMNFKAFNEKGLCKECAKAAKNVGLGSFVNGKRMDR